MFWEPTVLVLWVLNHIISLRQLQWHLWELVIQAHNVLGPYSHCTVGTKPVVFWNIVEMICCSDKETIEKLRLVTLWK